DAVLPPARLAGLRNDVVLVRLVARVHIHGHERESHRRPLAKDVEHLEKRPAVLAARQPHHDAIAVLDHLVVDDGLRGLLGEARFKLAAICHGVDSSEFYVCFTIRAGTPTATAPGSMFVRTTAPAPMTARAPIDTPSRTFAPAPSHAPSPIDTPCDRRP